jgi:hypothetical protein
LAIDDNETDMLITDTERAVIEAMRGGEEFQRCQRTILDIESTLTLYDVPIMAPLADSVLRVCEHNERLRDLLNACKVVVANDDLHRQIEEALNDLP